MRQLRKGRSLLGMGTTMEGQDGEAFTRGSQDMKTLFTSFVESTSILFTRIFTLAALASIGLASVLLIANDAAAQDNQSYFRLQLKHGGQYLDADHCSNQVGMNPGSDFEDGACQLWRFVPAGAGWNRLQLKHGGQYLDADHCSNKVGMNPGSDFDGGACQLWRFVPAGDGWSRLQLKHGGQYLDADHCSNKVGMNPGSDFEDGACQLWRFVRAR